MALFNYELLVTAALSYLLGSIPFGYILVRIFRGEDVRLSGSGNIGATNVSRKSPLLGVLTLLLDALKGSAAVALGIMLSPTVFLRMPLPQIPWRQILQASLSSEFAMWTVTAVLFVLLGHMFPVWSRLCSSFATFLWDRLRRSRASLLWSGSRANPELRRCQLGLWHWLPCSSSPGTTKTSVACSPELSQGFN